MPRQARKRNSSGVYHVMLRGNERKPIFGETEDKDKFVGTFLKNKTDGIKVFAYCVMNNHAHLLVQEVNDTVGQYMKRISVAYAYYYNQKHKRVGHVFQDRFRSEPIDNDTYLLAVLRYIHQNPLKAGIPQGIDYSWSSYSKYFNLDTRYVIREFGDILGMFSPKADRAVEAFIEFHKLEQPGSYLDIEEDYAGNDSPEKLIREFLNNQNWSKADLPKVENRDILKGFVVEFMTRTGLSRRKTAELLGLNREMVRRMIVSGEPSP